MPWKHIRPGFKTQSGTQRHVSIPEHPWVGFFTDKSKTELHLDRQPRSTHNVVAECKEGCMKLVLSVGGYFRAHISDDREPPTDITLQRSPWNLHFNKDLSSFWSKWSLDDFYETVPWGHGREWEEDHARRFVPNTETDPSDQSSDLDENCKLVGQLGLWKRGHDAEATNLLPNPQIWDSLSTPTGQTQGQKLNF